MSLGLDNLHQFFVLIFCLNLLCFCKVNKVWITGQFEQHRDTQTVIGQGIQE